MIKKNHIIGFVLFLTGTIGMATCTFAFPTLNIDYPSAVVVGDTFQVRVLVDGVDMDPIFGDGDLLAFGFDVNYDTTLFSYNGALVGPLFMDDSSLFPGTDVAGSTFPGVGGDDILLSTLSFSALVAGVHMIGIVTDISDPNEGLITFNNNQIDITRDININVSGAPVPEPSTIFLLGIGLVGFSVFLKRKRFQDKYRF